MAVVNSRDVMEVCLLEEGYAISICPSAVFLFLLSHRFYDIL